MSNPFDRFEAWIGEDDVLYGMYLGFVRPFQHLRYWLFGKKVQCQICRSKFKSMWWAVNPSFDDLKQGVNCASKILQHPSNAAWVLCCSYGSDFDGDLHYLDPGHPWIATDPVCDTCTRIIVSKHAVLSIPDGIFMNGENGKPILRPPPTSQELAVFYSLKNVNS